MLDPAIPRPTDTTLGELRAAGYRTRSVKEELRANLLDRIRSNEPFLPGILGYEETVLPQLENAILAGQDIILLGERGQAKSRIARSLVGLLDPWVPFIADTELHDDPLNPVSPLARSIVAEQGDATPIAWWAAADRYSEKLSTPDISIADLIGEVDPVKVAEGRYLSDELTIHYGLLPRTHRGIFSLNELPDLAERIQVGLLNVMEERDVQVRGYRVRLELDLFVIASANPEDYTSRGRIITPLKDRFGAQIRTHYPEETAIEIAIMEAEAVAFDDHEGGADASVPVQLPSFMKEVVAELSQLARRSSEVSQRSGVSVRVTIANHETLAAAALKRAVRLGEPAAAPRISDLPAVVASTAGKIELETLGDETREDRVVEKLVARAVVNVFNRHFALSELVPLIERFEEEGLEAEVGEFVPSAAHGELVDAVPELRAAISRLDAGESPAGIASATEFVLEGLHLNRRLNKERRGGGIRYAR
ncbi:MAG TPA: sigma 54-interacting transcriptional regulator [Candidatus Limnocylindrales bacterium]|nr:sigma 54-interacting transcriptional regulator [Candidatus Limnocylindrales bacterium]